MWNELHFYFPTFHFQPHLSHSCSYTPETKREREQKGELEPTPTSTPNVTLILTAKHCPHPHCQNFPTRFLSFSFSFPLFFLNLQSPKAWFGQIKLASIKTKALSCWFVELCHQSSIFCVTNLLEKLVLHFIQNTQRKQHKYLVHSCKITWNI